METAKLSTRFVCYGFCGLNCGYRQTNVSFLVPCQRSSPASCKMRSLPQKRRQGKNPMPAQPLPTSGDEESESDDGLRSLNHEVVATKDAGNRLLNGVRKLGDEMDMEVGIHGERAQLGDEMDIEIHGEHVKENHLDGQSVPGELKHLAINVGREEQLSGLQHGDLISMIRNAEKNIRLLNEARLDALGDLERIINEKKELQGEINALEMRLAENDARMRVAAQEKIRVELMESQLEKLRNELAQRIASERSLLDLNETSNKILNEGDPLLQDRSIHSVSWELSSLRSENESLKDDIEALKMKLNRVKNTDEGIVMLQKEHSLLESPNKILNKDQNLLNQNEPSKKLLNEGDVQPHDRSIHSVSWELSSLRSENESLKDDIEALKMDLKNVKNTDERMVVLEKERSFLESSLKDLESKLSSSQEEVSKLSSLKIECKDLWQKVESLQGLLDKATKQADQAILVLQQNQELRKKVDKLEESLEEAKIYKLSSEKMQQYNELMQQKIKLLEEKLQKSDEEIHSYVQLYQESVHEFQATLNTLKEESKKRALDEPVDDMPWEFWSRLLLIIDGWLLEKKISLNHANMLREMAWKRDRRIHDAYIKCREKTESEALSTFVKLTSSPKSPGLYVIHIAAEMAPVAKVGGLGDVLTGLSKAMQRRGHLVEIILPKYDCMQYDRIINLRALDVAVESYFDGKLYKNKIWVGIVDGLPVYFIEPLHPGNFFWRGQFYGERDDFKRFSYFSRAALELLLQTGKKPDIIHCHDWHTAFVAPLYWDIYAPKGLNSARICFTCHNFEYQGTAPASELASCGLDVHQLNRPDRMQDNLAHDRVNPVKGALVFSNIVTTVSPTYAQEVRTAEGGRGLHSTLNFHSKKFVGILNGIDTDAWNPAIDTFLKVQYTANDLQGKAENKMVLRRNIGLSTSDARQPLVGCITRLVPQKGVHLIRHAIYRTLEMGGQFVLLGSSPIAHIQREFEDMANQFQNHDHIRLILKYDESLSHSIYAASDMFIIPSIFEPCGLTQLIAMRYGSIPIVRKTGGLNDSVFDMDDDVIPLQFRNGFTFVTPDEQGVNSALQRAFNYYKSNPEGWRQLIQKVMSLDFSWESSASQYEELYLKSVARARAAIRA